MSEAQYVTFEQTGIDDKGKVHGRFAATGIEPAFVENFKALGIALDPDIFNPSKVYEW